MLATRHRKLRGLWSPSVLQTEQIYYARYLFNSAWAIVCTSLSSFFSILKKFLKRCSSRLVFLVFLFSMHSTYSSTKVAHVTNLFLLVFFKEICVWNQSVEQICIFLQTAWKVKRYQSGMNDNCQDMVHTEETWSKAPDWTYHLLCVWKRDTGHLIGFPLLSLACEWEFILHLFSDISVCM